MRLDFGTNQASLQDATLFANRPKAINPTASYSLRTVAPEVDSYASYEVPLPRLHHAR